MNISYQLAAIRFFTGVKPFVTLQIRDLCKCLITIMTMVGLLTCEIYMSRDLSIIVTYN